MDMKQAKEYFGSEAAIAVALKKSQRSIENWKKKGIPWVVQLAIQALTNNKLKADKK